MMKCKKCGSVLLMEQIPEVHISEAEVDCTTPNCNGKATYVNNKSPKNNILMEDDPGAHHG